MTPRSSRSARTQTATLCFLATLCIGSSAAADSFTFSGQITTLGETPPQPFSNVVVGDPWTLTYTFDTAVQDVDASPDAGQYRDLISELTLTIGSVTVSGVPGQALPNQGVSGIYVNLTPDYADYSASMSMPDSSAWVQVALWDSQGTPFADDSIPTVLPTPLGSSFDMLRFFLRMPNSSSYFLLGEVDAAWQQPAPVTAARADLHASLDQGSVSLLVDSAQYGFGGIASGRIDAQGWIMGFGESPFVLFVDPLSGAPADGTAALSFLTAPGGEVMGVEPSPFRIMLGTDSETLGELDFSDVTGYFPGPLGSLHLEGLVLTRPNGSVVEVDGFDVYDLQDGILLTEIQTDLSFDDGKVGCLVNSTLFGTSGVASGLLSTPGSEVMGVEPSPFRWVVDPDTGDPPDGERAVAFFTDPGGEVMGVEPSPFRILLVSGLETLGALDFSQVSGYVGSLYLEDIRLELEDGSSLAVDSLDTVDSDVSIDIKPTSEDNTINLGSAGVIPVAILSSPVFDATDVDPDTVSLAGAGVKVVGKGDKLLAHVEDIDGDGLDDLVCKILTEELLIECGASEAVLEAETFAGDAIRGVDSVTIVP